MNTNHSVCHSTVGVSKDADDLLWYAIVSQQLLLFFFKLYRSRPSNALAQSIKMTWRGEFHLHDSRMMRRVANLVCAGPAPAKAGLVVTEPGGNSVFHPVQ